MIIKKHSTSCTGYNRKKYCFQIWIIYLKTENLTICRIFISPYKFYCGLQKKIIQHRRCVKRLSVWRGQILSVEQQYCFKINIAFIQFNHLKLSNLMGCFSSSCGELSNFAMNKPNLHKPKMYENDLWKYSLCIWEKLMMNFEFIRSIYSGFEKCLLFNFKVDIFVVSVGKSI